MSTKTTQSKPNGTKVDDKADSTGARLESIRATTSNVAGAFSAGGRAYAGAVNELGKALFGFGKDVIDESVSHTKATLQAKSLRDVAELQAVFAQNRVENAASHAQEFVQLAKVKSEEVIEPFADLVKAA